LGRKRSVDIQDLCKYPNKISFLISPIILENYSEKEKASVRERKRERKRKRKRRWSYGNDAIRII
jgi:hypothetical protein